MADVSHSSVGYTGTVDQIAEAKRFAGAMGAPFVAGSVSQWQVTAVSGSNRTVQIAAGSAVCCGVRDTTAANATLTVAANSSGSTRYDVVVATFNWAAGTPVTSFNVITGTSAGIPTINTGGSVVSGQINRIPGVQYDAVLAVIQVANAAGVLSSAAVMDRRPYGGGGGPLTVAGSSFLTAVDMGSGGDLIAADSNTHWHYNGSTWTRYPVTNQTFASLSARDTYFTGLGGKVSGDRCICSGPGDGPVQMVYDGTAWRFTASARNRQATSDVNGFITLPHGGGQAPYAWTIVPAYQPASSFNFVIQVDSSSNAGDATVLGALLGRTDTNASVGSGYVTSVNWTAQF